eukprot:gene20460-biopygen10112
MAPATHVLGAAAPHGDGACAARTDHIVPWQHFLCVPGCALSKTCGAGGLMGEKKNSSVIRREAPQFLSGASFEVFPAPRQDN